MSYDCYGAKWFCNIVVRTTKADNFVTLVSSALWHIIGTLWFTWRIGGNSIPSISRVISKMTTALICFWFS